MNDEKSVIQYFFYRSLQKLRNTEFSFRKLKECGLQD